MEWNETFVMNSAWSKFWIDYSIHFLERVCISVCGRLIQKPVLAFQNHHSIGENLSMHAHPSRIGKGEAWGKLGMFIQEVCYWYYLKWKNCWILQNILLSKKDCNFRDQESFTIWWRVRVSTWDTPQRHVSFGFHGFPRPFGGLDRLDSSKNRFKRFFKESQQAVATIDMRDDDDEKWAKKREAKLVTAKVGKRRDWAEKGLYLFLLIKQLNI